MTNLIEFLKQNPPDDAESGIDYFQRIAQVSGLTADSIECKTKRMLLRNGFRQGINGLRAFLESGSRITRESPDPMEERNFNWRKAMTPIMDLQYQFKRGTKSTHTPIIEIDTAEPICVVVLADLHAGSWGTDYELFEQLTDDLINTPGLYAVLLGDLLQMAIKLRGVKEVSDNALPPKWQMYFLDSWLKEVQHKVLFSTWDNHSVMREEQAVGYSMYQDIFERYVNYSPGITHADVKVGEQVYKLACSHFFRGRSMYNPVHGQMRYAKWEGQDREVLMAGDSHVPGMLKYTESGKWKVAINCGSLQTNSGYAKRFYSLTTHPVFPCVVLYPDQHLVTPFWSVSEWLKISSFK